MSEHCQLARVGPVALTLMIWGVCMPLLAIEAVPSDEELERSYAVIGKVIIDNGNIFNLADPRENNWLRGVTPGSYGNGNRNTLAAICESASPPMTTRA